MLPLQLALGLGIGLALGLLGGGGSLLTVPALVYLVGQTPQAAVATSLVIVGANSAMGAAVHRARGAVHWRVALVFGGAGMGAAYLTGGLARLFAPAGLLTAFGALMLVIGVVMLTARPIATPAPTAYRWGRVALSGLGVGALTGLLGVGGGFLIVPALVLLVGLPMPQAVGTSLMVIAMNSLAALLGHGAGGLDGSLTLIFVGAGLAGAGLGARLAHRLPADPLRRGFGVFVIVLAVFLLYDNLAKLTG